KERGIDASGVLVFPREKKRENLYLTPEIEKKFRRIFYEMGKISRLKNPPRAERKRYCKKCSYYDLCWV
ncbi:MAG TPA: Dna2/Cas4 domain-containing protein, partial [Candidatus Altiarchaeales archaeon]|nr:Dna2/Cas4 domain-containing protein [Candidatus Altiarchaeales archaeon]